MTVDEMMWYYERLVKDIKEEMGAKKLAMQREKSRVAAANYRR